MKVWWLGTAGEWWIIKSCGKIVTPKYASVNFGRKSCKYCAGIAVDQQSL